MWQFLAWGGATIGLAYLIVAILFAGWSWRKDVRFRDPKQRHFWGDLVGGSLLQVFCYGRSDRIARRANPPARFKMSPKEYLLSAVSSMYAQRQRP